MVTRSRSEDGSENLSLRFAFVSICTAGLLLLGLPAQAQRQTVRRITLPDDPDVLVPAATYLGH